mgnify:CR=1 FL=1
MLVHKHLIVRADIDHSPTDRTWAERWLKQLVEKIGMKVCAGPISEYVDMPGNRGMTAVVIIETSHIAVHFWDEPSPNLMQFDLYSCGELDVAMVLRELETCGLRKVEYKFLDREHGLTEIAV